MRTKALVCLAALAASAITCMAQNVYSLNVVGYVNVTVPANSYGLIANQLNTTNNTLAALIPNPPPGTTLYKYDAGYKPYTFDEIDLVWTPDGNATLNPGEGALVKNVTAQPLQITFVGEVMQATNLTVHLPVGYAIRSSMVPQAGGVTTVLGYPAAAGDTVYKYGTGGWQPFTFDEIDLVWTPSEPTIAVGEGFMSKKSAAVDWVRNFTVQ